MQAIEFEKANGEASKVDEFIKSLQALDEKEMEVLKKKENKLNLKNVNKRNAQGDIENVQKAKLQKQKNLLLKLILMQDDKRRWPFHGSKQRKRHPKSRNLQTKKNKVEKFENPP